MKQKNKKTPFPLITRNAGEITYEHTLVENLPLNKIIAASEINLYVDSNHEINLCVYYNARISSTYDFDNSYHFYVTEGRACLDLYWNLGNPSRKTKILKKYETYNAALESEYSSYFKTMKERIEKAIKQKEDISPSHCCLSQKIGEKGEKEFYGFCEKTKEFVRLKVNLKKDEWNLMTSKENLAGITSFIQDFDKFDKKVLHLQTIHSELDVKNLDKSSPYYDIVEKAKSSLDLPEILIERDINSKKIKYMTYIHNTYFFWNEKPVHSHKIKMCNDGLIIQTEKGAENNQVLKKSVTQKTMLRFYKQISDFLTSGRLKQNFYIDDSKGTLYIHYAGGRTERYDRGLSKNDVTLGEMVWKFVEKAK